MNSALIFLQEIQSQDRLNLLIEQLNRTLRRSGYDENYDVFLKPEKLWRNLVAFIYNLIVSDFEGYLNLLYLVDVKEKKIKALPPQRVDEFAQTVSLYVLEREWEKVTYRSNF